MSLIHVVLQNHHQLSHEQNRTEISFWLGQYVHHLHNHNIYITRSRYQTNMYMYKSYMIVYIQLVDLCSTTTRNKKVSIQKLRMKNILSNVVRIRIAWNINFDKFKSTVSFFDLNNNFSLYIFGLVIKKTGIYWSRNCL